jgi:hypothetical protein
MMTGSGEQGFSCSGFLFILLALLFAAGFLLLCTGVVSAVSLL